MPNRRTFLRGAASACALAALPAVAQPAGSRILYVASERNDHGGLPRGAVETYKVNRGVRTLLACRPLSLSATVARSLVVAPGGRYLVVAAFGGGLYNVLPILADGTLGLVTGIFKELGSGPHPTQQTSAHPHSLVFHAGGSYLLASDYGCDRVSAFTLSSEGQLARVSCLQLKPGSGPGALTLGPGGTRLQVRNELIPGILNCRFHPPTGELTFWDSSPG